MSADFETKLCELAPKGQSINRDALFFELGKQQRKPYGLASTFLAGAIAASFPWLFLIQGPSQKMETSLPPPSLVPLVLIEPAKLEPCTILAYRKVFEATNDLPTLRYVEAGARAETFSDLQKEFSLYHP